MSSPSGRVFSSPTAMPGSELAVWTSSLPWCLTTQLGSIWVVPLGSKWTIWNFLKSVALMALFSGHTSRMSGMLSLSKSSLQTSPRPSPTGSDHKYGMVYMSTATIDAGLFIIIIANLLNIFSNRCSLTHCDKSESISSHSCVNPVSLNLTQ